MLELHDDSAYADAITQKEIVQFLLAAEREGDLLAQSDHSAALSKCLVLLDQYRQQNPALVQSADAEASVLR